MRTLGLDIGDRRIGVAISDPEEILASPLVTITRDNDDKAIDAIVELVNKHKIEHIVVGLPYSLNGNIGKQASRVMDFIEKLSKTTSAEIETRDERLSTVAVERLLIEAGIKSTRAKSRRDAAAAAFILQGYLDSLKVYDQ
ncbi:MAG: Holliday junction resolvase RuvX [Chloroflexi bacterium]|nr:Holliday junction resolvase RuvX [Chloroflexota bacterium]